ncbi:MAG: hypothetical protein UX53_C0039G0001 [Candidatus Azambacteria bacterium GW2011_GWB2_46_37]|uniref:PolyA polymerase family protein, poly(A) polymerase n=3 Tax=Candidatus Azamiibacteriota TaxID=1752741 RepID=A0A0G1NKI4_9BACT|nr:MAG: polyA polymerase family protein, poly(A) polymerase [Candidatus Azambacteria bacterium GW2011_GWC1_46_13]KKU37122.1 MAG: hypothetical protein UX51_C0032G0001 [Candidatus Azambacteria bacterium GW2011_GWF2_46_32]KKU37914.1 MAG: hypothetical protein UX53_C0039G0001 [Candidatus Azambacteria bacterium GW2011_GWB2_46_37]HAM95800.1 hypothetical protein [Candidatus Azambacteria bacterium]HAQ05626.1 hypothetical protein [Candidatus Azambacteria bacterium]
MVVKLPSEISEILKKFNEAGYEAYAVGGCVRDLLRGVEPEDWDVTTGAKPEEIQKIFPDSVYTNAFGTVIVKTGNERPALTRRRGRPELKIIEVTTFRIEKKYSDKRHPDEVAFADKLEDDLGRRDFTINAMASDGEKIIDPFGGQNDLKNKLIKTVGSPEDRFNEDALRMLRAPRFAVQLGFDIEEKTAEAIKTNAGWLQAIAKERIRDEFVKIINSERPTEGVELLRELGLLRYIIPELLEGAGVGQNKHHIFSVWDHNLRSLDYAAKKKYDTEVRIAALLHDVAKPRTKHGEGPDSTFYGHDAVGARMAIGILNRLRFPKHQTEKIADLVRYHLFYYNVGEVTEASIRRLVRKVGPENVEDLLKVRICDRIGSGVPKAEPYKLRHLRYLIEKVSRDPISVKMLAINGDILMAGLALAPGHKIGYILNVLLEDVLNDPKKNKKEFLIERARELNQKSQEELKKMAEEAKQKREEVQMKIETVSKKKYWVT